MTNILMPAPLLLLRRFEAAFFWFGVVFVQSCFAGQAEKAFDLAVLYVILGFATEGAVFLG